MITDLEGKYCSAQDYCVHFLFGLFVQLDIIQLMVIILAHTNKKGTGMCGIQVKKCWKNKVALFLKSENPLLWPLPCCLLLFWKCLSGIPIIGSLLLICTKIPPKTFYAFLHPKHLLCYLMAHRVLSQTINKAFHSVYLQYMMCFSSFFLFFLIPPVCLGQGKFKVRAWKFYCSKTET